MLKEVGVNICILQMNKFGSNNYNLTKTKSLVRLEQKTDSVSIGLQSLQEVLL